MQLSIDNIFTNLREEFHGIMTNATTDSEKLFKELPPMMGGRKRKSKKRKEETDKKKNCFFKIH